MDVKQIFGSEVFWVIIFIAFFIGLDHLPGSIRQNSYSFPYFTSMPVSYSFDGSAPCSTDATNRVNTAFNEIQIKTDGIVSFEKLESGGKINVKCLERSTEEDVAGLGGPTLSEDNEIIGGEIELYDRSPGTIYCASYPVVELHEILHVFAFDHRGGRMNIMHEGGETGAICSDFDQETISCLKNIYSNGKVDGSCEDLPKITYDSLPD